MNDFESNPRFFNALIDQTVDGLIIINRNGEVLRCNTALCTLFGYLRPELEGQHVRILLPSLEHAIQENTPPPLGTAVEVMGIHKLGTELPVRLSLNQIDIDGQRYFTGILHDLSEQLALQQQLAQVMARTRELDEHNQTLQTKIEIYRLTRAQLHLVKQVMERSRQAIIITDAQNIIQEINDAFVTMTGFSRMEAIGNTPRIGKSKHHDKTFYQQMWANLTRENYWAGEIWDNRKNGEAYLKYLTISRVLDETGQVINYVAMFEDLTEQKALESELERRMHYDTLTGLANKVLFRNRLEYEFSVAERHKRHVGLLLLNLDRFRQVNESLGYLAGDRLIQAIAIRLTNNIRKTDLIARDGNSKERSADTISRVGGDEFTFILADLVVPENSAIAARRMIDAFKDPYMIDGQEIYLSASVGIAVWPLNAVTLEGMMICVEKALADARLAGGNTFRFFSDTMNQVSSNRFLLESEMRKAIAGGGFILAYQPKVDLASGEISGVEALVRWQREDGHMASPVDFIPLAEETGLILPLGEWILETACHEIQAINRRLGRNLSVAVNLSARQFQYGKVPQLVDRVLAATGLPAHLLELEITESMVMRDVEAVIATMHSIRVRGVTLAIDDFGTGYSSLAYLKSFPIHTLKIDRSFVMDIENNRDAAGICGITVLLAHQLEMVVVAEGVETLEQLKFLHSVGCEMVQGYLISKPLFAADIETFIRDHQPMREL